MQDIADIGLPALIAEAERIVGALRGAGATPSGFTAVRPRDMDPALEVLERVAALLPRLLPPEETALSGRALALVDAAMRDPGGCYELVRNRLRLVQGRLLAHAQRWEEADRAFADLAFQPHTACDDIGSVREAMLLDRVVRPNLAGATPAVAALLLERLLFLLSRETREAGQRALFDAFVHPLRDLLRLVGAVPEVAARTGLPAEFVGQLGTAPLALAQLRRIAAARRSFDLARASLARDAWPRPTRRWLVTRGMGGAGDVATMIPGAVALAHATGAPVHFAVPRSLVPLMQDIDGIVPLAAEDAIDFAGYETWFNFSECPASRAESAVAPLIATGRIEIFAAALGVTPENLDEYGWTARFRLDGAQEAIGRGLRDAARRRGRTLLGVAPFSREEYKASPALLAAVAQLKDRHDVVVLHTTQLPALDAAGLRVADTPDLRGLIATIAACDYLITIDTVHLHLAGALGVPTLAIFGPTDGRLATRAYKATSLLQPWARCGVMPCWRHEDSACQLSLGPASLCLQHLGAADILDAFATVMQRHPVDVAPEAGAALTLA